MPSNFFQPNRPSTSRVYRKKEKKTTNFKEIIIKFNYCKWGKDHWATDKPNQRQRNKV